MLGFSTGHHKVSSPRLAVSGIYATAVQLQESSKRFSLPWLWDAASFKVPVLYDRTTHLYCVPDDMLGKGQSLGGKRNRG